MRTIPKTIIATSGTIFIGVLFVVGVWRPLHKSQLYTSAQAQLSQIRSVAAFFAAFDYPIAYWAPTGGDELRVQYLMYLQSVISQTSDEAVINAMVQEADRVAQPLLERGKGFDFGTFLNVYGSFYVVAGNALHNMDYIDHAQQIFEEGLLRSPGRLQFLYGLLDIARIKGDDAVVKKIADSIFALYPNDSITRQVLDELGLSQ